MAYARLARLALTREELFRSLWLPPANLLYSDFLWALEQLHVEIENGFVVFLSEDRKIIKERQRAVAPSELMLRRAKRAVRLVRWVPFLEAIFVCNSVGAETAKAESDIDWFVITTPGRIWFVRAVLNVVLRLAGLRTYGNHEAGRMCLSFFVDRHHLDMAPLRVVPEDIHFAYWLHQMVPVYDPEEKWIDFIQANAWASVYIPLTSEYALRVERDATPFTVSRQIVRFFEKILARRVGNIFERSAKYVQRTKLRPSLLEKAQCKDQGVVITSGVLKFHEHDTRRALYEAWQIAVKNIGENKNRRSA